MQNYEVALKLKKKYFLEIDIQRTNLELNAPSILISTHYMCYFSVLRKKGE